MSLAKKAATECITRSHSDLMLATVVLCGGLLIHPDLFAQTDFQ